MTTPPVRPASDAGVNLFHGHLGNGGGYEKHETWIVGDELGLRALIEACEAALEAGESEPEDLGEFCGVRKLPTEAFSEARETMPVWGNIACLLAAVFAVLVFGLGVIQLFRMFV